MKILAQQHTKPDEQVGLAEVLAILALITPSFGAFVATLALHNSWADVSGLWFFYQVSLAISCGTVPLALGLTGLAIYGGEPSIESRLVMGGLSIVGVLLTWYAKQW
jgi:hypothetical protein